jgi:DNA anti-recombination protein RmuC
MGIGPGIIFGALGVLSTLVAQTVVIIRVLDKKSSDRMTQMDVRHNQDISALRQDLDTRHDHTYRETQAIHSRIDDVKDHYIRREEHEKEIRRLHEHMNQFRSEVRSDMNGGFDSINHRLADLQNAFTKLLTELVSEVKGK